MENNSVEFRKAATNLNLRKPIGKAVRIDGKTVNIYGADSIHLCVGDVEETERQKTGTDCRWMTKVDRKHYHSIVFFPID